MFGWFRKKRTDPEVVVARGLGPTSVTLTSPSSIAGIEFPAGTTIHYWERTLEDVESGLTDRLPREIELATDVRIDGLGIPGGSRLAFTESGALDQIFVDEPCDLLEVPCGSYTVLNRGEASWWLSETELARDYEIGGARYPRGTRLKLDASRRVVTASHAPVPAPPGYAATIRNLYPAGRPDESDLKAMPIPQGASAPPGFVKVDLATLPIGPVLVETTIEDPSLRTLGDLRRHYPSDETFELHVAPWGQPLAVRKADGAQFSLIVGADFLTFDEKVLDSGRTVYETTEIERVG